MTKSRDLANRTLDNAYAHMGEGTTYYPFVGGMLQAGLPVTVMPTTRDPSEAYRKLRRALGDGLPV